MKKGNKKKLSKFTISMDAEHERILLAFCNTEKVNKSLMIRKMIMAYENSQKREGVCPIRGSSK